MKLFGTTLSLDFFEKKYGGSVWQWLWKEILFFMATGAVLPKRRVLKLTSDKAYYLVILMREFFSGVNRFRELY